MLQYPPPGTAFSQVGRVPLDLKIAPTYPSLVQMVESHVGKLPLVTPGDVVELVEGMEDLYIMGTVDGFQKVTKIDGLEDMSALTVSLGDSAGGAGRGASAFFCVEHGHDSCAQ